MFKDSSHSFPARTCLQGVGKHSVGFGLSRWELGARHVDAAHNRAFSWHLLRQANCLAGWRCRWYTLLHPLGNWPLYTSLKLCLLTLYLFCGPSGCALGSLYSSLHNLMWNTWQISWGMCLWALRPSETWLRSLASLSRRWLTETCISNMKSELVPCIPEPHRQETLEFSPLVLT